MANTKPPSLEISMNMTSPIIFILYVHDQTKSTEFYRSVLQTDPVLDVPGMTEFEVAPGSRLGLMPISGIRKILRTAMPDPENGHGIPRCELYLPVDEPSAFHGRAVANGGISIEDDQDRDWGDRVAYCADPDGHVLAFARRIQ